MASTPGDAHRPWLRPAAWAAAVLATAALAVLAARADLRPGGIVPAAAVADLALGFAFVGGAALAPGSWRSRALFAGVGLAWLVGSIVPTANLAYLSVLAIALTTFPSGRPRGARDWILVCLALVALVVPPPRLVLAALFAAVAATAWVGRRWERVAAAFPTAASTAIALELALSWLVEQTLPHAFDPQLWQAANELMLFVVAVGFPVAGRAVIRERILLADRLLGDQRIIGLDGLAVLLADTLGDPRLRIHRWDEGASGYIGSDGATVTVDDHMALGLVDDGGERLAALSHTGTAAMNDPVIAAAVVEAVRLTALNERRHAAQRDQLAELEAARARLIAATDRQRAAIAARLRDEVVRPIEASATEVRHIDVVQGDAAAREALEVAARELDASAAEILALTGGVAPATLGNGGLAAAIEQLARRCPLPVSVVVAPDTQADQDRETALFYVCSEALANAIKHAGASRVSIELRRERGDLVVTVADDGVGGARPSGSGLHGLGDRLAVFGGRLQVDSPPGAGTTLTARIGA